MAKKRSIEISVKALTSKASQSLKTLAGGALAGLGVAAGLSAVQITKTIGRALVRITQQMLQIGMGFQASMSNVNAITRGTASEMKALEGVARKLGETTVFTAGEAAKAMESFALAGFSVNEVLAATPAALNLAAAGQLTMADAADITSNILRQFNIDASETERIVDVLAGTATTSNQTVRDMGEAMKFAGITANQLGITLEETAALLGKLADRGIRASMGGTALRRSFAVFMGQLEPGETGLVGFNAALATAEDGTFSMAKAIDQLRANGITTNEVMQAFGQRAGPAMAALIGIGGEEIQNYTNEIAAMGGVAKQVGEDRLDNLKGDVTRLTSVLSETAILIFKEFSPALRAIAEGAIAVVGAVNSLVVAFNEARQAIIDAGKSLDELELDSTTDTARVFYLQMKVLSDQFQENTSNIISLSKATNLNEREEAKAFLTVNRLLRANADLHVEMNTLSDAEDKRLQGMTQSRIEAEELARSLELLAAAKKAAAAAEARRLLEVFGGPKVDTDIFPIPIPKPFIDPDGGADEEDDSFSASVKAHLEAEDAKRAQIEETVRAVLQAAIAVAASDAERHELQAAVEAERYEQKKEALAGNDEALENARIEHQLRMQGIDVAFFEEGIEKDEERLSDALAAETERFELELETLGDNLDAKWALEADHQKRLDLLKQAAADAEASLGALKIKQLKKDLKAQAKATGSALAELFGQQKAFSTIMAIISTADAVTGALGFKPWTPLNIAMAALMAAEGAAQIAIIQGASFATGGLVPFVGNPGVDSVPAMLTPGEEIVSGPVVQALTGPAGLLTQSRTREAFAGSDPLDDSGAPGGGITIVNTFNVNGEEADDADSLPSTVRELMDDMNDLVIQQGGELVASAVLRGGSPTVAEDL